jgi:hypothetical protein
VLIAVPEDFKFELMCKSDVAGLIRSINNERDLSRVVEYLRKNAASVGPTLPGNELVLLVRAVGDLHEKAESRQRAAVLLRIVLCDFTARHVPPARLPEPLLVNAIIELIQRDGWPSFSSIVDDFVAALQASAASVGSLNLRAHLAAKLGEVGVDDGRKKKVRSAWLSRAAVLLTSAATAQLR